MTFDEATYLPSTFVMMADGQLGRIIAWHAGEQSVEVAIPGRSARRVPVAHLVRGSWCAIEVEG